VNLGECVIPESEVQPESNSSSWLNLSKHTLHTMARHIIVFAILP